MEKKLLKLIIAGLAVIAVFAAALIVVNNIGRNTESGVTVFVSKNPEDIKTINVKNSYGSYEIHTEDEGYVFDDMPANIIDSEGFYELMFHASGYGALKTISANPSDLSVFGLKEPQAAVDVEFNDGEKFRLLLGDKEKVSGNYYGMANNDKSVYLFSSEDVEYFLLPKIAYISLAVTPELAVTSPLSAIRDITFSGSAFEKPITVQAVTDKNPALALEAKSFGPATHLVKLKGTYELDQTYGIEMLGSVLGIKALEVAGYNLTDEDLVKLGFDAPYVQVDFSLQNGTDYIADYQLKLVPYGEYYMASMKGSGVAYLIEPPAFVGLDYSKLCMRWFLSPLRTDLESLTVEFDGQSFVYTSGEKADGNIYATVNGKEMDRDLFFSFYRLVTSAAHDGKYLEDTSNEGSPLMTITYKYKIDGKQDDVMKLYKGSVRRVNVDINGVTEFDMLSSYVEAVKTACAHTLVGEAIEEDW